jgi:plastocyanin
VELNSGNIAGSGGVFAHTFNTAGSFGYHCAIHTNMTGTITVVASGGNTPVAAGMSGTSSFTNGTQTINVGGTVTWTNSSGIVHTVTSN